MKKLTNLLRLFATLLFTLTNYYTAGAADILSYRRHDIRDESVLSNIGCPLIMVGDPFFTGTLKNELPILAEPIEISSPTFLVTVLDDGSFRLTDKINHAVFQPDPWGDGAGMILFESSTQGRSQTLFLSRADHITRTVKGNSIEISFIWQQGTEVQTRLALEGEALTVSVEKVTLTAGARLDQVIYPSRFASLTTGENGYLILPARSGAIIPSHFYTRTGGEFWRMDDAYRQSNPNGSFMPYLGELAFNFCGVQRGSSGLTFICDDPFDAGILFFANTRGNRYTYSNGKWSVVNPIAAISSVWRSSLGELRYRRQLTIRRHGQNGYVESATLYRKWLDSHGWSRTLVDKIKQNPDRAKLIGATHIDIYGGYPHYTPDVPDAVDFKFDQITSIIDAMSKELKIDKASITVWGTFENYPPNCWPINERRGGVEAWKRAVDHAKQAGYLISGYHSYTPQEEHDPNFDPRLIFQSSPELTDPLKRVISAMPRWRRTCTSLSMGYAKKNLPLELAATGQNADFVDIMGVWEGLECYDITNHKHSQPLTREQEKRTRLALFEYIHDELNLPNFIENGSAADLKTTDSFHGEGSFPPVLGEIAIPVPLAALVAHDCVVLTQHPGQNYRHDRAQFFTRTLLDIIAGNQPIHCLQVWEFNGLKQDIIDFYNVVARIHKQVGLLKMVDHQFLPGPDVYATRNFFVQKSIFSDGTQVYVNFGKDPYQDNNVKLDPYGFEARLAGGEVLKGSVQVGLHLN
jgi:hypothetical protein